MFCKCESVPEVDVRATNIFFYSNQFLDSPHEQKGPWKGGREKDFKLQVFVETLTKPIEVVHDAYASACDYRPQCQSFIFDCSLSMFLGLIIDFCVVSM